jgi:hypothetical protein
LNQQEETLMMDTTEKEIVALVQKGATTEAEKQIAALRAKALAAQRELAALKEKLGVLEKELKMRASLSFDGQFYWTGVVPDQEGPFCQACYDTEHLLMRLQYRTVEEIDYDTGYTRPGAQIFYKCLRCSKKSKQEAPR